MNAPLPHKAASHASQTFLPNVGSGAVAIRVLFAAIVVAVVLALGRNASLESATWQDFGVLSLFSLGIGLVAAVLLAVFARGIRRMSLTAGSVSVFILLLAAVALGMEGVFYGLYEFGFMPTRWPENHASLLTRALAIGAIVAAFGLRYLVLAHRAEIDAKAEQEARMQALQSRIRPHFLFNSMNSIASLTRSDPARAEAALQDLADLFRVLLADARKLVPISAEREISRQYLEIEKLRLGDRLKIVWSVNNIPRNALVPALTLQPLLENAIYHGIEPRFGGGTVKIELWTEGETLFFMISNPLPEVPKHAHGKGNKIALDNIRQRLSTHFGANASMQHFDDGAQYHVKIKMPILKG